MNQNYVVIYPFYTKIDMMTWSRDTLVLADQRFLGARLIRQ